VRPRNRRSKAPENQKNWDPTGEWAAKHPDWKGKITIRPDGTFARGIGDGGKWRLTNENGQAALELNWEKWDTQVLPMISPDLFRGKVRRGTFELRRIQTTAAAEGKPKPETEWLEGYQAPALKERLNDSVWRLKDGKRFTLRADGSTSGSWHNRKGQWRIVGSNKIQLTMNWKPSGPAVAAVESDGTVLRWSDSEWGQVAKRVEKKEE
jgi:hypothetical protein